MTYRGQKQGKFRRIAVVGAVVRTFAGVAVQAQGLQILDQIRAAVLYWNDMIDRERATRTTTQTDIAKTIAHRKPITPAKRLAFYFGAAFVLIHLCRNAVPFSVRFSPRLRLFRHMFLIALVILPVAVTSFFGVIQTPFLVFSENVITVFPIRTFLFLAVVFWILPSSPIFPLKNLFTVLMIVPVCFCVYLVTMRGMVFGFFDKRFVPVFFPLRAAHLNIFRVVFTRMVVLILFCANRVMIFDIPLFAQVRITRLAFGAVLATFGTKEEVIQRLEYVAETAFLTVKEGMLYNTHVNLHKRLAAPRVFQHRVAFRMPNYNILAASNQGFSASGGLICPFP